VRGALGPYLNVAQGAIATFQGIGASLSGLAAGIIVDRFGYGAAFTAASAIATVALAALALAMPETAREGVGETLSTTDGTELRRARRRSS